MRRQQVEFNVSSKELDKLFAPSNELTTTTWMKIWESNVVENLQICQEIKPISQLICEINRHICLVVGAGPSLRKLKKAAPLIPPEWGVIVTDHALKAVLDAGLRPTVVVTMDGHQKTEPVILDGFDLLAQRHPEVPVMTDLVTCPSVTERIKNPFWFRNMGNPEQLLTKFVQREVPGIPTLGHGGNVGSVCCIISKFMCFARHAVLIGFDSCMQEGSKRNGYWYGRTMPEEHQYIDVSDIYGRPVVTMANLHNYKWWLDHFTYLNDDVEWINANDGGFLGVCNATSIYNHYKYLTLPQAVEYLRGHGEDD